MEHGSPRIPAARWVIGLGRLYWGLSVCAAAWSLLGVVFAGRAYLLMSLVLAGVAAVWGALVRGFESHRRGAWCLLVVLTAVGSATPVVSRLTGGPVTVLDSLSVVVHGSLLALLLHPDSREWVAPATTARGAGWWSPGRRTLRARTAASGASPGADDP
jgi:hypothetical protein